jgi:hypothetical protein
MPRTFQSLIQSDFGPGDHGNLEAVIIEGDALVHWWRDSGEASLPWKRTQTIVAGAVAGPGALIQSDFGSGGHGNFEVVVPLRADGSRVELWHYFRKNSDAGRPWQRGQRVTGGTDDVAGPAALIQSDFRSGNHGNFEVVVPLRTAAGRVELWHYFRKNSDVALPWQRGQRVTGDGDDVAWGGSLIQSDFRSGDHGNFEVVVPLRAGGARMELWHFFHDNADVRRPWQRGQRVAENVTGPGVLIQSDFGSGAHGNFEVLVPEGRRLVHYWHDNSAVSSPWRRGQTITESLAGWAGLIQSDFGSGAHTNFEVLTEECGGSVVGYFHPNERADLPWLRDKPVIPRGYEFRLPGTRKISQLTGGFERQGWNGVGRPPSAPNRTETRFGIRGTDLGSSFRHKNRTYFLFGDTWRVRQRREDQDLDSIAFTTNTAASDGLTLEFLSQPPRIRPPVPQGAFNVPLDGVSLDGAMFVFFSTDYRRVGERDFMGRSILTRSDNEGLDFDCLYEFSRDKFINVSVERVSLDAADAAAIGVGARDVLCIWGSGRYRSSDVYLAVLPSSELASGRGRRFYAGDGAHAWSGEERDATPLFCAGCVGELSARWNPFLERYLVMFQSDSPRGIVLHAAPKPWGPWTREPIMVFDPWWREPGVDPSDPCLGAGYGAFMHVPWNVKRCDHVHDNMFGSWRENVWGGEYGPYQIGHMATGSRNQTTHLFFLMSTWNPYQVMLMTARLPASVIHAVEHL